ncbi:hypothetical protein [Xanthomonas campestris]|uniref:hypothetical protein n=1 Tax=Xanthomonas campestris TaxID=339 RepID=UPI00128FEFDD|nr:hypothetical protein [Xanthomonas campestris]
MSTTVYVGCPKSSYLGDPHDQLHQLHESPSWDVSKWTLKIFKYKADGSIDAGDFSSAVLQSKGPVLLLQPIQANAYNAIHLRLSNKVPVLRLYSADRTELSQAINDAIDAYVSGEPMIPRDIAVALMLIHKLDVNHMWAGNAKSYMWTDDLQKGRGFNEDHTCRLGAVLRILLAGNVLIYKISKSSKKYALNPEMRSQINDIMRRREFPTVVQKGLLSNDQRISVREIDHCIPSEVPPR